MVMVMVVVMVMVMVVVMVMVMVMVMVAFSSQTRILWWKVLDESISTCDFFFLSGD